MQSLYAFYFFQKYDPHAPDSCISFCWLNLTGTWLVYHLLRFPQYIYNTNKNFRRYYFIVTFLLIIWLSDIIILIYPHLKPAHKIIYFSCGVISLLYGIKQTGLRKIPFLKYILIPLVWMMVHNMVFYACRNFSTGEILFEKNRFIMGRFFLVLACLIPFDIHDRRTDLSERNLTLPVLKGKKFSFIFMLLVMFLYFICERAAFLQYIVSSAILIVSIFIQKSPLNKWLAELVLGVEAWIGLSV